MTDQPRRLTAAHAGHPTSTKAQFLEVVNTLTPAQRSAIYMLMVLRKNEVPWPAARAIVLKRTGIYLAPLEGEER